MGTRGSPPPLSPNVVCCCAAATVLIVADSCGLRKSLLIRNYSLKTGCEIVWCPSATSCISKSPYCHKAFRISPRPISIRQLHTLLHFHLEPIDLVVFQGSYVLGNLILRGASRLDAFSAYPVRTWLPSYAPGGTTGTPAVRPSRPSRTKDSSSQISCAHDR